MLLASRRQRKTGAEDALAIYRNAGLLVNGCKNVSHLYRSNEKTSSTVIIFRTLLDQCWEWQKSKAISCSDWSSAGKVRYPGCLGIANDSPYRKLYKVSFR